MLEDFRPADTAALLALWRESFEFGVGIVDPHPLEEQRTYFEQHVRPRYHIRVAREAGLLLGFIAADAESVAQLYVRVGQHRRGIGRQLLDGAKRESQGTLWLFAFARNVGACAFYERQGFVAVQRGFEPSWQLEDVKYQWRA